jgi:hypothetical protein
MSEALLVPEKYQPIIGKKKENPYSLVETPISKEQIESIFSKTPAKHIKRRPAKGGGEWEYVSGVYVKKVLSFLFGFGLEFGLLYRTAKV